MGTAYFERGAEVRIEGHLYVLRRMIEDDPWQLEDVRTGRIVEKSNGELRALYADPDRVLQFEDVQTHAAYPGGKDERADIGSRIAKCRGKAGQIESKSREISTKFNADFTM